MEEGYIVSVLKMKTVLDMLYKKMHPNGEKSQHEFMVDVLICFFLTVTVEDDLMTFINESKDIADIIKLSSRLKKESNNE